MAESKHGGPAGQNPVDKETLRRVVARDPDALNTFFDHYFDRVYTHVAYLTGDPVLAEDLTQDAFIRLHRAIDRLDPDRDPAGWIFTVVTNAVRDHWRSKQHQTTSRETALSEFDDLTLRNGRPTPDQRMERQQAVAAVREALLELSSNDREVLLLRSYEGLKAGEIAEMLEITPEAVRQRHSRALSRLGEVVKKKMEHDQDVE